MATITITAQDVARADAFLEAYLTARIPDADFSPGSANRDITIKAIAYVFAYLEAERQAVRKRQSLRELAVLEADESVDDAVDALLSNWYLTRKTGGVTRTPAVLHFSRSTDVTLTPTTRFFKSSTRAFTPDITLPTVYPASDLRPSWDANGVVTGYTLNVSFVAQETGANYNIAPGRFVSADTFNPFFLYAENTVEGAGGYDKETTAALLERAPTALAVRNLVNERSIATVLRELFNPRRVLTVGFGDPEMTRDLAAEAVSGLRMHTGGHTDIYLDLPCTEVTETLAVGGAFARPDGRAVTLRDENVDFIRVGVCRSHVLRIVSGLPRVPREFRILTVAQHALTISPRDPFSLATDELDPVGTVRYSVGYTAPAFNNIVLDPVTGSHESLTGVTSRKYQEDYTVLLKGQPHYAIKSVEAVSPAGTTTQLNTRINVGEPTDVQYKVTVLEPATAQSRQAMTQIRVHSTHASKQLRVTYETVSGYDAIQNHVTDRFERVLCSNGLVRAFHPVYISVLVECRPNTAIDKDLVARSLAAYINDFDPSKALDVTELGHYLRSQFPALGIVFDPLQVRYSLHAPDGQLYHFRTDDVITVQPATDNSAYLINEPGDLRAPVSLAVQLQDLGVSDRTVRYVSSASLITITTR